ncbi:hypothetical protein HZC30_08245 [Candidatus Woesearchaeota archaeon]|nr:hypothetical protein [Candidatus Woesearchaeota archaeon]
MPKKTEYADCQYLNEAELPALVLAVPQKCDFKGKRIWQGIAHQTAGHGCHQHYMYGTILKPRPELVDKLQQITQHWLESDCGMGGSATLDEVVEYRKQLQEWLGVDCNTSYPDFEEGIYPIDCNAENLRKLSGEKFPKNLNDFIKREKREFPYLVHWQLYILGENCD